VANIQSKTLQDLEFPTVLQQVAARCNTELGKLAAKEVTPFSEESQMRNALGKTSEYLSSFISDNRIPNHGFDTINSELQLLKIENTTLELQGFKRIATICDSIATHQKFEFLMGRNGITYGSNAFKSL
jgi:DNA mismatch repair protein MutS2